MTNRRILVAGAGGAVGYEIARALRDRQFEVTATYRTARAGLGARLDAIGVQSVQWDINDPAAGAELIKRCDGAVFTPILDVSSRVAPMVAAMPAVFFSSNNVVIDPHTPVYASLRAAEDEIRAHAPDALILRPTMIYGHPDDGNLSRLMRFMRKSLVAPMIGRSSAQQQPVYFRDFGALCADAFSTQTWRRGPVAVAGPAPTTARRLYKAVRRAAGARCMLVPTPRWAGKGLISLLGDRAPLTAAQLARADRDKLPAGEAVVLGQTPLADGLAALAAALDGARAGA